MGRSTTVVSGNVTSVCSRLSGVTSTMRLPRYGIHPESTCSFIEPTEFVTGLMTLHSLFDNRHFTPFIRKLTPEDAYRFHSSVVVHSWIGRCALIRKMPL